MGTISTAKQIENLKHPGDRARAVRYSVAGAKGLLIQVTPKGKKSWSVRYSASGKQREKGLGSYPELSLAAARDAAAIIHGGVARDVDPIADAEAKVREQARLNYTFTQAMDDYEADQLDPDMSDKDRKQWRRSLEIHVLPNIGEKRTADIVRKDIGDMLKPIWLDKPVTAKKVCNRVRHILDLAIANEMRPDDNPADLRGPLAKMLPKQGRRAARHQPALAVELAPAWFAHLKSLEGNGSRALAFVALAAARSGEVRGARWDEIDLDAATWTVPAERMKMRREHRVPLSTVALALLTAMPREGNPLVFPAVRGGMLSDMTLSATMRRMTEAMPHYGHCVPHGLRSTFRNWCERTAQPYDLAEQSLAHQIGSDVERAYRHDDNLERRRVVMQEWAEYLTNA